MEWLDKFGELLIVGLSFVALVWSAWINLRENW